MLAARVRPLLLALATVATFAPSVPAQNAPEQNKSARASARMRIKGRVIDDVTGKPLSGATVRIAQMVMHVSARFFPTQPSDPEAPPPPPPPPPPPREIITGADGEFSFDDVPADTMDIRATKAGYTDVWGFRRDAEDPLGTYQSGDLSNPITLRLAPVASISGVIRNPEGLLMGKTAQVVLLRLQTWAGWARLDYGSFATFAEDGTYHFDNLPPGRYYINAAPAFDGKVHLRFFEGHALGEVPVRYPASSDDDPNSFFTLHEGEQAHIDLQLPEATLHRVTLTGDPVSPMGLSFVDTNRNGYMLHSVEGTELEQLPRFEAWLPTGSYWLDNGRAGEIDGPMPVEVKDSDISSLHFTIVPQESASVSVPIEVASTAPPEDGCPKVVPVCGFVSVTFVRLLPGGYVEASGQADYAARFDSSEKPISQSASLYPGIYMVELSSTPNLYTRSIRSGDSDLAIAPLVIRQGVPPDPVKIDLAPGAAVEGIVYRDGKPARAWVYSIAEQISTNQDLRVFQPAFADEEAKFRVSGLAPGSYLFFASNVELSINIHDPAQVAYWRSRGKTVRVEAGKTANLDMTSYDPPDEPY